MQALIDKFLQRIIHKAMTRNPRFTCENWAFNSNAKMRALATVIGTNMSGMGRTFVQNLHKNGVQTLL